MTPQVVPREKRAVASVRTPARGIPEPVQSIPREPTRGIPCEGCGAVFTARRPAQRFCRPACRPLARRRREADRLAAPLARLLPDDPRRAE
jgi:hypothetical protein